MSADEPVSGRMRVCVSYLDFRRVEGGSPLELLVNRVLQTLTHTPLLVSRVGFQTEQAVTLLQRERERERESARERESERERERERERDRDRERERE